MVNMKRARERIWHLLSPRLRENTDNSIEENDSSSSALHVILVTMTMLTTPTDLSLRVLR